MTYRQEDSIPIRQNKILSNNEIKKNTKKYRIRMKKKKKCSEKYKIMLHKERGVI